MPAEIHFSFSGEKTGSVMLNSIIPVLPENISKGINLFAFLVERKSKEFLKDANPFRFKNAKRRVDYGRSTSDRIYSRTGALRASINVAKSTAQSLTAKVGPALRYGAYNEFGAPSINLPARPWLRPNFEKSIPEGLALIKKEILRPLGGI